MTRTKTIVALAAFLCVVGWSDNARCGDAPAGWIKSRAAFPPYEEVYCEPEADSPIRYGQCYDFHPDQTECALIAWDVANCPGAKDCDWPLKVYSIWKEFAIHPQCPSVKCLPGQTCS